MSCEHAQLSVINLDSQDVNSLPHYRTTKQGIYVVTYAYVDESGEHFTFIAACP
jgi:hypothetical protein